MGVWCIGPGKVDLGVSFSSAVTVVLGTSTISRPRLPHLHSKGVRMEAVNVNKDGASLLGNIWKCYGFYACVGAGGGGRER